MKTYFFKAYNIDRKKISSTLEFNSTKEFHRYLNKNRLTLISYKIITPKYKITQENILIFTQNLKTLLDSGLTISLVLDILSTQEKDIQFSKVIKNIRDKILNGNSIYSAFYDYNTIFGDTYLNLLLAGEEYGELVENLDKICEIISLKEKIKKNIKKGFLGGGSYYFPENYLEKAESECKTANKYGTTSILNYSMYNAPATGSININKTSEDGVIEGLSFKLESFDDEREYGDNLIPTPMAYDEDGNEITSLILTTDANGKASTNNEQFYDVNGNKIDGILPYVFNQNGFQITYRLTEIGIKQSDRSEERRVGKECRSRWSPYH